MKESIRRSCIPVICIMALLLLAFAGCGQRSTPLLRGGTPAPNTPVPGTTSAAPIVASTPISADNLGKGTIRFANPGDNRTAFENTLAGYVMVWGYGYSAELVDTSVAGYKAAFDQGLVDVVMEVDKAADAEWYNTGTGNGKVVDAGSLMGPGSSKRIVVRASLRETSPELVAFLGKISMEDAAIADWSGRITTGRIGVSPAVATLSFLKSSESWRSWTAADIADKVKEAIDTGKTSLRNRGCIPLGNEGGALAMRCM